MSLRIVFLQECELSASHHSWRVINQRHRNRSTHTRFHIAAMYVSQTGNNWRERECVSSRNNASTWPSPIALCCSSEKVRVLMLQLREDKRQAERTDGRENSCAAKGGLCLSAVNLLRADGTDSSDGWWRKVVLCTRTGWKKTISLQAREEKQSKVFCFCGGGGKLHQVAKVIEI